MFVTCLSAAAVATHEGPSKQGTAAARQLQRLSHAEFVDDATLMALNRRSTATVTMGSGLRPPRQLLFPPFSCIYQGKWYHSSPTGIAKSLRSSSPTLSAPRVRTGAGRGRAQ